jgi:hypothetical protein
LTASVQRRDVGREKGKMSRAREEGVRRTLEHAEDGTCASAAVKIRVGVDSRRKIPRVVTDVRIRSTGEDSGPSGATKVASSVPVENRKRGKDARVVRVLPALQGSTVDMRTKGKRRISPSADSKAVVIRDRLGNADGSGGIGGAKEGEKETLGVKKTGVRASASLRDGVVNFPDLRRKGSKST